MKHLNNSAFKYGVGSVIALTLLTIFLYEKKPSCSDEKIVNEVIKTVKKGLSLAIPADKVDELVVEIINIGPTTEVRDGVFACRGGLKMETKTEKCKDYMCDGSLPNFKWLMQKNDNGKGYFIEIVN